MAYVPWEGAWRDALYGPSGFFRCRRPNQHFRTSATSDALAQALADLARDTYVALGSPDDFTIVDVGAGDGQLLAQISTRVPADWHLHAVDVRDRPAELTQRVRWTTTPPPHTTGLLIAHELLDAIPCPIVQVDDDGLVRRVEVNVHGQERPGSPATPTDLAWLDDWWPLPEVGQRAELGGPRDDAWRSLVATIDRGLVLAVDYGHSHEERKNLYHGTLSGYRDGLRVPPIPDGTCDITAHVALDACAATTSETNGSWTLLTTQTQALKERGVSPALPPAVEASANPRAYTDRLAAASESRLLLDPQGPGGFGWLLHGKGLAQSAVVSA